MINRTDVSLGIAYFSIKVVSSQILKYAALQLLNAYKERINPYQLSPSISFPLVPYLALSMNKNII